MANWSDPRSSAQVFPAAGTQSVAYDAGLRRYMLSVYNYMASAVLLTGIVALGFALSGAAAQVFVSGGILKWIITLAPLGFVFGMSFGQGRMTTATLQAMFWGFAVAMGLSLSTVFLIYTGTSIAQAFFAAAASYFSAAALIASAAAACLFPASPIFPAGAVAPAAPPGAFAGRSGISSAAPLPPR